MVNLHYLLPITPSFLLRLTAQSRQVKGLAQTRIGLQIRNLPVKDLVVPSIDKAAKATCIC